MLSHRRSFYAKPLAQAGELPDGSELLLTVIGANGKVRTMLMAAIATTYTLATAAAAAARARG